MFEGVLKELDSTITSGEIVMKGDYVTTDDFGIRPMIKITYNGIIFIKSGKFL